MGEFIGVIFLLLVIIIPLLIFNNYQEKAKAKEIIAYAVNKYSADDFFRVMFFESKLQEDYRVERNFYNKRVISKEEYEKAVDKIQTQRETLREFLNVNKKQMDNYYKSYLMVKDSFEKTNL